MVANVQAHKNRSELRIGATTALAAMLLVAGCSGGSGAASASLAMRPVGAPQAEAAMAVPAAPGADAGFAYEVGAVADMVAGAGGVSMETPAAADREIIVTGNAELAADDPVATSSQIASYVESIGGTIASRNEWRPTPTSPGGASLSLRIPAGRLNSVIDALSQFGEVRSTWLNQWDVTEQAVDLDARINALQTSVTRLTQLMADAADTSDLLNVERELSRRQADLDSLRASRNDLSNRVAMSTLDLNIVPTPIAIQDADPHPGFLGGLQQGWRALVGFARGFAVVLGAILPWLIALGVLAAIIVPLIKWWRKRREAQYQAKVANRTSGTIVSGQPIIREQPISHEQYRPDDDQ